jgi:branched-chain amino acid transport system substrate-binding protein
MKPGVWINFSVGIALAASSLVASAQEPIKVGVVAPMSGVFAAYGKQIEAGINVFLRENGDSISGRKLQIIYKDNAGPNAEAAKRLAQELVIRDKVDILAGFAFTPDALAAAPVATEARKPLFLPLAGTSIVTTKSPYIVRTSYTNAQVALPMGQWAAKNKYKKVFSLVSDYGPGLDAETWFKKGFNAELAGSVRVPVSNREFAPYLQRIKDAKPEAVFIFLPAGEPMVSFMKGFAEREMAKAGIKILALEGWADDDTLAAVGDPAIGAINTGFYSTDHQSAVNRQFISNFVNVTGGKFLPNFLSVASYDTMKVIAHAIQKQGGKVDPDATIEAAKGYTYESPRGTILIDPETRDVVHDIYVRRVEKVNGKLVNREFDVFKMVKDPGK